MQHLEFKTSDIVLASYLKLNNIRMIGIEKQGLKGTFVFENVSDSFIVEYDLGKASVEPVAFNNTIKALTTSVRRMVQ